MSAAPEVTSDDVLPAEFDLDIDKQLFAGALAGLMSDDIDTRAMAAKTMSCIRHELSRRALVAQLARDTSVSVRAECVNALTKLEAKECLFAIERALDDSKAAVRLAAVRGVYRLAGEEGIDQLVRMLDDVNEDVRRRAATCLGWLGHKPVAAKLMPLLSDTHAFVRGAAVDALGNLGSSNAVSEIHELLSDPVESVRKRAHLALQTVIKMTATRNDSKQNETSNAGEQDSETDSVMVCLSSDAPSCVRPSRQVAPATLVRNMVA
jgi:HEAT repeat protein